MRWPRPRIADRRSCPAQIDAVPSLEVRMPDIFFKCGSCGDHLVADDAGAGQTIDCPDCNTPTTIPEISTTHQCPQCRQRLKFSPEMKGELVHCPACHGEVRLPGQHYPETCPKCGAGWVKPLHRCQSCSYSMDTPPPPPPAKPKK
jgi:DNA-directed RNA polymerase subunit RPC12/RpoP